MSKLFTFASGAKVFYRKNTINQSTGINISFDCGSRCDNGIAGLAHFCEHMFFTGTKTENKQQISKQYFDFINVNAHTDTEAISFTGNIFTRELNDYLSLVAKLITESTFSKENVESEKKVVLQEIMRDSDNYKGKSARNFSRLIFNQDFFADGILGNEKSVQSITSKDVKNYIHKYFVANNCRIYISSPIGFGKIKKIINDNLISKLETKNNFEELGYYDYNIEDKNIVDLKKDKIEKNFLSFGFKIPYGYANVRAESILVMISAVMDDISDGVLKTLRLEKGLVYSASCFVSTYKNNSIFVFRTELNKNNIKEATKTIVDYINNIKKNGVNIELINKQKHAEQYYFEAYVPSVRNFVTQLEIYRKCKQFLTIKEIHKIRQSITKDEVDKMVQELFNQPRFIYSVYGDAEKTDLFTLKEITKMLNN